ncbi:hypothetical protein K490DRAFT_72909 [Saccharata proteae CBS 121410]|uniref:Zn(2)-C6 fungal-type domain-containing protein n=1 Tax=Saccharata proteae CBS 121410 TaxID=1314787 RepID=A0A9P4HXW9_9PEZI|nr:hypothetical protein K490DRAFT_72909 [Saccharata proteae CBS 121410]
MVYTGKPSRACQTCKKRRVKCDEARPFCGNCKKSGRTCPGFVDEFDLVFRDENAAVVRRSQKRSKATKSIPSESSSRYVRGHSPPVSSLRGTAGMNDIDPRGLSPTLEDKAIAFFFRNHVLIPQHEDCMRGHLDILLTHYNKTDSGSPLHTATNAVAMHILSCYPGRGEVARDAAKYYGRALQQVGKALHDPVQAKSDQILMCIMMFTLYEALVATDKSMAAWANHVDGAATLVRLRGAEQFQSPDSRRVFQAARSMMVTASIWKCSPMEDFPWPDGWLGTEETQDNLANRFVALSIGLPMLRARSKALISRGKIDEKTVIGAKKLLDDAREFDASLEDWARGLPEGCTYRTVTMVHEISDDVEKEPRWLGPVHSYRDVFIANVWNDYRINRIICQSIISTCAKILWKSSGTVDSWFAVSSARFISQSLADDICASIPFLLTYEMQIDGPLARTQDSDAAEGQGAYLAVWPLYIASIVDDLPAQQLAWLKGRLLAIANNYNLQSARAFATAREHILAGAPSTMDFQWPAVRP